MGARRALEAEYDYEIVDEFMDHFGVSVELIEPLTLQLEEASSYVQAVNELFRIFHNTKSAAGYLHIEMIAAFSALVEDVLENLRQTSGPAKSGVVDWLLLCDDQMQKWYQNLSNDTELLPLNRAILTSIPILH
ncbi:MAG: hypothetical protein KU37_06340 [Sulfuricurvum sp. PC08-66]|nr:MAG: hypothetical protein KU37_06340 [Sulfuricurvum sp. PC08-66]